MAALLGSPLSGTKPGRLGKLNKEALMESCGIKLSQV
jgi:hypothetical protein